MLLQSLTLGVQVSTISSVLGGSDAEGLDVAAHGKEGILTLLEAHLGVSDLHANVGVAALLEVNLFSEVVVLSSDTLVVSAEGSVFGGDLGVLLTDAAKLTLGVLEGELLVAKVGAAAVQQLLGVFDAGLSAAELEVKGLELVGLLSSLRRARLVHLLKTGELSPHLGALHLHALDLALQVLQLGPLVVVLVTLLHGVFSQASGFEVLLIQKTLGTGKFIVQVQVLLGSEGYTNRVVRQWHHMGFRNWYESQKNSRSLTVYLAF